MEKTVPGRRDREGSRKGIILLISVLSMAPPLSTDMYLPALPHMSESFDASTGVINLTMVAFFFFESGSVCRIQSGVRLLGKHLYADRSQSISGSGRRRHDGSFHRLGKRLL